MDDVETLPPGKDKFAAFLNKAGANNSDREDSLAVIQQTRASSNDEYYEEDDEADMPDETDDAYLRGNVNRSSGKRKPSRHGSETMVEQPVVDSDAESEAGIAEENEIAPEQSASVASRLSQRLVKRISRRLSSKRSSPSRASLEAQERALADHQEEEEEEGEGEGEVTTDDVQVDEAQTDEAAQESEIAERAPPPRAGRVRRLSAQWEAGAFNSGAVVQEPPASDQSEPIMQRIAKRFSRRSSRKSASLVGLEDAEETPDADFYPADEDGEEEGVDEENDGEQDAAFEPEPECDDFVEEDEDEVVKESEEDADQADDASAPEERRGSAVQNLISLFVSGAVNTKTKPEKRSSLTALRKARTLSRHAAPPAKLLHRATPHDEFKLSLGPNRGDRHETDEDSADDADALAAAAADDVEDAERESGTESENDDAESESGKSQRSSNASEASDSDRKARFTLRLDRIRSMNLSPSCPVCDKPVYRMEKLSDSRDRAFHYYCLKCEDCPKNLSGEVVHVIEGDEKGRTGGRVVLCATHYHLRENGQSELVKGWRPDTSGINYGGKYENDPERARKAVSRTLGASLGRKPVCTRCGGEIMLSDKDFIVNGLERFHMKCPEQNSMKHTPRHYVQAAPERLPLVFSGFADGKIGVSFLLRLESEDAKEHALVQHRLAPATLRYVPDETALSSTSKSVRVSNEFFSISDRKHTFTEDSHPLSGKPSYCEYDEETNLVLAQHYKVEAGVVHGLNAAFRYSYDENTGRATVEALVAELTFELIDQEGYTGADAEYLHTTKPSKRKSSKRSSSSRDAPDSASLLLKDDFAERMRATY
ncbi:Cysteine and glycine-rich protein 3 [Hondaea fermentalgiana]|uniref:Cysteine and glycine-rich protein 3 n=1 Tax=Hondaea fermentalgiana TaxID=2315210 RepID=A0A2R5GPP5_9STRA|nr:Cysteine and glycine-rich protein 3 [Hondaea fermentalgiana]|eukprot:GBG30311.1 Cysteine and glycine-rich protein 3 [Hondaea fermentalgiana]